MFYDLEFSQIINNIKLLKKLVKLSALHEQK